MGRFDFVKNCHLWPPKGDCRKMPPLAATGRLDSGSSGAMSVRAALKRRSLAVRKTTKADMAPARGVARSDFVRECRLVPQSMVEAPTLAADRHQSHENILSINISWAVTCGCSCAKGAPVIDGQPVSVGANFSVVFQSCVSLACKKL